MGVAAAVAGGSAILGAGANIWSANNAASQQRNAANSANTLQKSMFDTTQGNLAPYVNNGATSGNMLERMLSDPNGLLKPFNPTMADLSATPGYQFTLQQGENAVNNANSAKGWGLSGAGQKGLADYVTGLASNTYQQQFQNYWAQNQNIFGMLYQPTQLGESAAAGQGALSAQVGATMGTNTIGAGNAGAAASLAGGNAIANAPINGMAEYNLLEQMMNGGGSSNNGFPAGLPPQYAGAFSNWMAKPL